MAAALSESSERVLVISRVIDAPRALVFRMWTDPAHVARWWGPQGFVTTFCEMDIRVGGAFRQCMRSPQGTDYWKRGVYREITPPERIVFTFAWEDANGQPGHELLTTVSFEEHGEQTRMTLRQEKFATKDRCDDHREGWASCFERFAAYVESIEQGGEHRC